VVGSLTLTSSWAGLTNPPRPLAAGLVLSGPAQIRSHRAVRPLREGGGAGGSAPAHANILGRTGIGMSAWALHIAIGIAFEWGSGNHPRPSGWCIQTARGGFGYWFLSVIRTWKPGHGHRPKFGPSSRPPGEGAGRGPRPVAASVAKKPRWPLRQRDVSGGAAPLFPPEIASDLVSIYPHWAFFAVRRSLAWSPARGTLMDPKVVSGPPTTGSAALLLPGVDDTKN